MTALDAGPGRSIDLGEEPRAVSPDATPSGIACELRMLLQEVATGTVPVATLAERRLLFRVAAALAAYETAWVASSDGDSPSGLR